MRPYDDAQLGRRPVVARFDAAPITSDGGSVLLREVDRRIDLLWRMAGCFVDHRNPGRIQHSLSELISQRVLGLALCCEDLNDHDRLREDALRGLVVGRVDPRRALASKSTPNRLELTPDGADASPRYIMVVAQPAALDDVLIELQLGVLVSQTLLMQRELRRQLADQRVQRERSWFRRRGPTRPTDHAWPVAPSDSRTCQVPTAYLGDAGRLSRPQGSGTATPC